MMIQTKRHLWMLAAILIICGASVFTGCSNDDNPSIDTPGDLLMLYAGTPTSNLSDK